ncbi:hypothetical protein [Nonlabens dokdonensis]|uniref:hypothetical protein n=1 Tax=Nonlabens dokdonensis TaxID=328515 RepID=UPI0026EBACDB|nr:hypothetical protein [Nonlabens dokdonensis]
MSKHDFLMLLEDLGDHMQHKQDLELLLKSFLESPLSNDHETRCRVLRLYDTLICSLD